MDYIDLIIGNKLIVFINYSVFQSGFKFIPSAI